MDAQMLKEIEKRHCESMKRIQELDDMDVYDTLSDIAEQKSSEKFASLNPKETNKWK